MCKPKTKFKVVNQCVQNQSDSHLNVERNSHLLGFALTKLGVACEQALRAIKMKGRLKSGFHLIDNALQRADN